MTEQQQHAYTGVAGRRGVTRRAVLGGAAGALGLLAAACEPGLRGATPPPVSQTKEPVTLTWWGPGHWRGVTGKETDPSATLMDWYAAKAAEFSQQQPHVTFNLEAMASGTERRQKLELAIVADSTPDVSYEASSLLRKWARLGAIEPVDGVMTKGDGDDFLPALLDQAKQDGKTWFWPWLGTATMVCLNRKLFELKNATRYIPQGAERKWTYEQFVEAAQAVTERSAGVYGFGVQFTAPTGGYGRSVFLWNRDSKTRIFSEDGKRIVLNTPAAVEGLQFLLDLDRRYNVMPPDITALSAVDVDNLLWSRNLAMYNGAQSTFGIWRQRVRERRTEPEAIDLYPVDFPATRGVEPISYIEAGGYATFKQRDASKRRAALEFGRFLTTRDNTAAVEAITAIPARRSALDVYKDDPIMQWITRLNQDGRKVAYDALHPLYVDVRKYETDMYVQVMRQERSPKDALDEFARLAQEELRQKGYA